MDRRRAIALISLSVMPMRANAQKQRIPVVGFLRHTSQRDSQFLIDALRTGLRDTGFVENRNVSFELRFADGQRERMSLLAKELVGRKVDVLVAAGAQAAEAAKRATTTIPVVFITGEDVQRMGLVGSLSHPGGNVTGVSFMTLNAKRLELFHLLVPKLKAVAYLVDPNDRQTAPLQLEDTENAARALGIRLVVFDAGNEAEIASAFARIAQQRLRALHVGGHGLFLGKRDRIVALAMKYSILTTYQNPEGAKAGALMSYGASSSEACRQAGVYVGRILKGTKPGELPVVLSSKPELLINLKTAKALGVTIPQSLLQRADDVIQ